MVSLGFFRASSRDHDLLRPGSFGGMRAARVAAGCEDSVVPLHVAPGSLKAALRGWSILDRVRFDREMCSAPAPR